MVEIDHYRPMVPRLPLHMNPCVVGGITYLACRREDLTEGQVVGWRRAKSDPAAYQGVLCREFTGLDSETTGFESEALDFARRFGFLRRPLGGNEGDPYLYEPIDLWRQEIRALRHGFTIWDQFLKDDAGRQDWPPPQDRADMAAWFADAERYWGEHRFNPWSEPDVPLNELPAGLRGRMPDDEHTRTLLSIMHVLSLRAEIGRRVEQNIEARLTMNAAWEAEVKLHCTGLLAPIWLQFADIVAGRRKHGRCKWCNQWFWADDKGAALKGKRFCNSVCRTHFNNERRRKEAKNGKG